jgi:hypothetical protein
MSEHEIADKSELKSRVRSKTLYDDSPQELQSSELDNLVHDAMLRLDSEAGVSSFFADVHVQRAILYASCIEAKAAIENYSVDSWDVGAGRIDVSGAGDPDQFQFQDWADQVAAGLAKSDEATVDDMPTNINNYAFIN